VTREAQATKNFFRLNGGLNTEINELNFPDGYTRDETNYELLVDGSRRRRKGLAAEASAATARTVASFTASVMSQNYLWRDAGGDNAKNIVVYRQGNVLHFADVGAVVSGGWYSQTVALEPYETSGSTTANTDDVALTFTQGRGYLFVSGPYLNPIRIEFDGTDTFTVDPITVKIRDFSTIEDGINTTQEPTGTITDDHRYNLRNRGWNETDMAQFLSDVSKHPAKNAVWYKGYKRTYGTSIFEADGQRSWDSNKLDNEAFGASSAPVGSLFIEPHDTTIGYGVGGSGGQFAISTWSFVDNGSTFTITITTTAAHGLTYSAPDADQVTVIGQRSKYSFEWAPGEPDVSYWDFNGSWSIEAGTTGSTIVITVPQPPEWDSSGAWVNQYLQKGSVDADQSLARSSGTAHGDSMGAIEFHAGRLFYGGMQNTEFADWIFFSQIADSNEKFGKCFQEADPTDENFNALTSADGGAIVIPGMSGVLNLISLRNSLIVVAREGVWEISGGQRGVFTADAYSVRKLSDQGCNSARGIVKIENAAVYTGNGGVFFISPNQYTGQLEVTSTSENTIQTLWNQIPVAQKERMALAYDDSLRRLYFMYGADGTQVGIETMLIFDARAGAWFKYTFTSPANNELLCGFTLPEVDDASNNQKMKFFFKASATTVQVGDFVQTSFDDWHGANGALPYLVFGHDNLGDWQRRRQAPIITVFSKRTETGYTEGGSGWTGDNESSTLMSAYWDWTDDAVSNKIGAQQEVYRHVRTFVPASANDVDGYPVVVTRNKVRGRGRALQLRFDGATDKDSHILGFQVNYKVSNKK
jgi:hypothetical protein